MKGKLSPLLRELLRDQKARGQLARALETGYGLIEFRGKHYGLAPVLMMTLTERPTEAKP